MVLISANVTLPDPAGVTLIRVGTTEELRKATLDAAAGADAVVMAAAPADFRPAEYAPEQPPAYTETAPFESTAEDQPASPAFEERPGSSDDAANRPGF